MSRISRNRAVLELAEKRARQKTICLVQELEEEEEAERQRNGGFTNDKLAKASFDFPGFLGVTDGSNVVDWSALDVPGRNPIETGESSRGAIQVPKCFLPMSNLST